MGTEIRKSHFSASEEARFAQRLDAQLRALDVVLKGGSFGQCERSVGAELELCLFDELGSPLAISEQLVREAGHPEITPEMGAFDIELSTPPVRLAGAPFSALRESMQKRVRQIRKSKL